MSGVFTHRLGVFQTSCPIAASVETDDAYYNNVAFMVDANGQADGTSYTTDESRHGHTITYNGNAAVSSNKFVFDGTGDYLSISDGNDVLWAPGSRFTIELRGVVFNSVNTRQVFFSSYDTSASSASFSFRLNAGNLGILLSDDGVDATTFALVEYAWSPSTGVSYDLTITWDGSTVYLYIDGLFVGSDSYTGPVYPAKQPLRVGCDLASGTPRDFLDGSIRAIRFTKGAARWTNSSGCYARPKLPYTTTQATTTDTEWDNVVLLLTAKDNGQIWDDSPYDWSILQGGNVAVSTSIEPFADANSTTYDGTTDYLRILDNPYIELGSGDYTIETFARHTVNTNLHHYAGQYNTTGNQRSWAFQYRGELATDILRLNVSSDGTSGTLESVDSAAWTPTVDTWYHVAACRSGANKRLFVGGTQTGSTSTTGTNAFDSTSDLYIGAQNGTANSMNGYLTEMRVTKSARYTSNFTAPSAVLQRG